jgi:hypothetical protein
VETKVAFEKKLKKKSSKQAHKIAGLQYMISKKL